MTESRLQSFLLAPLRSHDCWPAPTTRQPACLPHTRPPKQRFTYLGSSSAFYRICPTNTVFFCYRMYKNRQNIFSRLFFSALCVRVCFYESKHPDKYCKVWQEVINWALLTPTSSSSFPEGKTSKTSKSILNSET